MENIQDLETALKPVEVKEVVYGRDTKFAVYATEAIDPGLLVSEFMGQIRSVDSLLPNQKRERGCHRRLCSSPMHSNTYS